MSHTQGLNRVPRLRYHFKHSGFDFLFQWLAGAQTHGGAELGEAFFAASETRDGDSESWIGAWTALGQRVEQRAADSLSHGHLVSAREAYLRAYIYYRAALAFMNPRADRRFSEQLEQARLCFRCGASLLDLPLETVHIPFEDTALPGLFLKAAADDTPRPALIMIGGGDTFLEDLYFYIGPAGQKHGYNVLMADLPGQGDLPDKGLVWRPDAEIPMAAVVDYALSRHDVDGERLAAYGLSGGGYLVPRAATRDKRLKAIVACSIILDMSQIWAPVLPKLETSPLFKVWRRLAPRRFEPTFRMLETYKWRWGVRGLSDLIRVCRAYTFDPALITCPTLNLLPENEYRSFQAGRVWAYQCLEHIAHPNNRLVIAPRNEGADSHGAGTNLSLMSQIVFDWLDEVFQPMETETDEPALAGM